MAFAYPQNVVKLKNIATDLRFYRNKRIQIPLKIVKNQQTNLFLLICKL